MDSRSFAGLQARPSPWGYNWGGEQVVANHCPKQAISRKSAPVSEDSIAQQQYAQLPAALLNTLKKDKKPFTYTPGGVNLPEVLEARLQRRIERKKRYSDEQPPKQVVVMSTYNTPLDMYSMENAVQALELQADIVANDSSLGCRSATLPRNHKYEYLDSNRGVTQSKAFKVLQIITDTDRETDPKTQMHQDTEMRFRGLRDSSAIPSKFFHTLQKITGTDQDPEDEQTTHDFTTQEVVRPGTTNHMRQHNAAYLNHVHQPPLKSNNQLRRPAAFLPAQTGQPQFKPVKPSFLINKNATGVTDF